MTDIGAAPARPGPGRPSSGARERILAACLEVLKSEGYAGVTIAKVAARAGENKALVSYHFGSKQGVIAAAARVLGESITERVLAVLRGAETVEGVVSGVLEGIWAVLEEDDRVARVYFDLNSVSVIEGDIRDALREIKAQWREVVEDLLQRAGVPAARARTAGVMLIAGGEGLSLEWLERGNSPELRRAREMFASGAVAAIEGSDTMGDGPLA